VFVESMVTVRQDLPVSEDRVTLEDMAAKFEWEGLPDGLEWFKPEEVPEEIREAFSRARALYAQLQQAIDEMYVFLPDL